MRNAVIVCCPGGNAKGDCAHKPAWAGGAGRGRGLRPGRKRRRKALPRQTLQPAG